MKKCLAAILCVGLILLSSNTEASGVKKPEEIENAIRLLKTLQLSNGDFPTLYCHLSSGQCRIHEGSVFNTALVLTSLYRFRGHKGISEIYEKGITFIKTKMEKGFLWRFYGKMDMDLDDTSCSSYLLKDMVSVKDNIPAILSNRDSEGRFFTWIREDPLKGNDVDAVVNVNVLRYLGQNEHTVKSCDWVMELIESDQAGNHIPYYADVSVLYYLLSIFYKDHRSDCIHKRLDRVSKKLIDLCRNNIKEQKIMGSALCLNALRNFSIEENKVKEEGRELFLKSKGKDGGWKGAPLFYSVDLPGPVMGSFQSDSFTAALIIEFFLSDQGP